MKREIIDRRTLLCYIGFFRGVVLLMQLRRAAAKHTATTNSRVIYLFRESMLIANRIFFIVHKKLINNWANGGLWSGNYPEVILHGQVDGSLFLQLWFNDFALCVVYIVGSLIYNLLGVIEVF